ncbi:hypothetical protein ACLB2K_068803 [Fragaria x ananassa]
MTVKQINLNSSRGNYIADLTDFERPQYKRYHTVEEFADGLSRGSKHGGVSAIIEEIPYLKIFLSKYSADYSMIKPKLTTNGFGFVFPKGSKLGRDMSRQIEILREEGKLLEMEKAWFQISDAEISSNPAPELIEAMAGRAACELAVEHDLHLIILESDYLSKIRSPVTAKLITLQRMTANQTFRLGQVAGPRAEAGEIQSNILAWTGGRTTCGGSRSNISAWIGGSTTCGGRGNFRREN